MPMRTLEELRALVGEAGADCTDAQLLSAAESTRRHATLIVGAWRDRLDPDGAHRRAEVHQIQERARLAPRRARDSRASEAQRQTGVMATVEKGVRSC